MCSAKRVDFCQLEYNVFGMCLDKADRCWIHDGQTNQIVCLDKNLKEKAVFDGISFNRRLVVMIRMRIWKHRGGLLSAGQR